MNDAGNKTSDDDQKNGILDFLSDSVFGHERDAVTRAFYEYAQGDPHSYPVGMAVLLTACTRKLASLPRHLNDSAADFWSKAQEVTRTQEDQLEKLRTSHAQVFTSFRNESANVIAVFKDEKSRANDIWRQTVQELLRLLDNAKSINNELSPVIASAKQIAQEVQSHQAGLRLQEDSARKIVAGVEALKVIHEEAKATHKENKALVSALTNDARANWLTLGLLAGMLLAATFMYMPWWGDALASFGAIFFLQVAFRG
jgi:hypothetical protein